MKAEIKKDGFIHVIAETYVEAFALEAILARNDSSHVVLGGSILNDNFDRGGNRNQ